jgi:hypothetical protein
VAEKLLAEQKEKEAQERKKLTDAIEAAKLKLRAKAPKERKVGIDTLARLGEMAAPADYELCEVIAFDPVPELKRAALAALEKVRPELHPVAVTLTLPPEEFGMGEGYVRAIKRLPEFGRAGLPLIAVQLQGRQASVANVEPHVLQRILEAHGEALAKIAPTDETALKLLMALPTSPLAMQRVGDRYGNLRVHVGELLLSVVKEKPEIRKATVPYFIEVLKSPPVFIHLSSKKPIDRTPYQTQDRLFAAKALASLGGDAVAALPALKALQLNPTEKVRDAVRAAIAEIEKGNK